MLRASLRGVALLAVLATAAGAETLTVGPAGSGAQFAELQAAIDAAAPGDVIRVHPGIYQRILVDKPLRILGDGPELVRITGLSFAAVVRDIGPGQELVLSGLSLRATRSSHPVVLVEDSPGTVVLHDLAVPAAQSERPGLRIADCGRCFLLGALVRGGVLGGSGRSPRGALLASGSEVWIADSEVSGSDGDLSLNQQGAHGVEVEDAALRVWNARIRGGHSGGNPSGSSGVGGTAIRAVFSRVELFGGPDSESRGGNGAFVAMRQVNHAGGPGLALLQGSWARIQAAQRIEGGLDGRGLLQAPGVTSAGFSSFRLDARVVPTLSTGAPRAALGASIPLVLHGTPLALQVPYLALGTGPTAILRIVDGFSVLDPARLFQGPAVPVPSSGRAALDLGVPPNVALLGQTVFLQTIEFSAGRFALSNPALFTILP